jgi:hypothetical protein
LVIDGPDFLKLAWAAAGRSDAHGSGGQRALRGAVAQPKDPGSGPLQRQGSPSHVQTRDRFVAVRRPAPADADSSGCRSTGCESVAMNRRFLDAKGDIQPE